MDGVTGALIAFPIEKVLNKLFGVAQIIFSSKSEGKELKKKLSSLKAAIDEISKEISKKISDSDSLSDRVKQYKDFQAELNDGLRLVDKIEKIHGFDLFRKYRYGKKVLDFHKKIKDFIDIHGSPDVVHDVQNLTAVVEGLERRISDDWEKLSATMRDLERLIREDVIPRLNSNPISNTLFLQQINTSQTYIDMMNEPADAPQSVFCTFQVPAMPKFVVGLDNHIDDVRQNLLQDDVNIVGVTGMGGSGKTTLALALCNDLKVHASFHDIIFITVSNLDENTNGILDILKTMWDKIVRGPKPNFRGIEDARYQLQENLKLRTNWRTLVILDDVWSKSNAEQLLFEAKGYKTIVTTREESTVPAKSSSRLYKMSVLEEANALSLFCFWAFDSKYSIPTTEREDLVKQVAAQCGGLPLALKVIGSCLRGQPRPVWESAKDDLSRAEYRKRYHKDALLDRLEMSINTLDDESAKAVFFGLGGISPRWKVLCGFVIRHLGICPRNEMGVCLCGFVRACKSKSDRSHRRFQHDVMRDLALRLASQNSERLFMPCKDERIPRKWQTDQSSRARFLSIHTGAMEEQNWCQIDFREVEALGLFFASSEYCLPTFLHTMPKLKVLIIYNYGSQRARLSGLPNFPSPVQIRSVLLNKLIVPPLYENCKSWETLEKLYVCLCEGLGNIILVDNEPEALNFPNIIEINLDHCSDLGKLPNKLCSLISLQRLSITNCHHVPNLPDDLGRLILLKVLRLSACLSLSRLPLSICKLRQLEYLDISLCSGLQNLPTEFDRLSNLETLDMRECSRLRNLPASRPRSLKHVIISENDEERRAWQSTIPNLTIRVVRETFSLSWLGLND